MELRILCYHNICPLPENACIKNHFIHPRVFEKQMRFLHRNNYRSIRTDDISTILKSNSRDFIPLLITFDDGYEDNFHYAAPILEKYGFTGVFFITAGRIGQECNWKKKKHDYNGQLMTAAHIHELSKKNMEIHSHSVDHCFLSQCNEQQLNFQLNTSKQIIERITDKSCNTISYPAGKYNDHVIAAAKKLGYCAGFTTEYGINTADTDIFKLHRIEVKHSDIALMRFKKRLFHRAHN